MLTRITWQEKFGFLCPHFYWLYILRFHYIHCFPFLPTLFIISSIQISRFSFSSQELLRLLCLCSTTRLITQNYRNQASPQSIISDGAKWEARLGHRIFNSWKKKTKYLNVRKIQQWTNTYLRAFLDRVFETSRLPLSIFHEANNCCSKETP